MPASLGFLKISTDFDKRCLDPEATVFVGLETSYE